MNGSNRPVVCFDGDGTLWDFHAAMRAALTTTLDLSRTRRPGAATAELTTVAMIADLDTVKAEMGGLDLVAIRRGLSVARSTASDLPITPLLTSYTRSTWPSGAA